MTASGTPTPAAAPTVSWAPAPAAAPTVSWAPAPAVVAARARLVIGAGCSLGCPPEELAALVSAAISGAPGDVIAVATVERRAHEPCVLALAAALGVPLRVHAAAALAAVDVPTPSDVVARHLGTPSVAEAAALLSAGPGARLVVTKRRSAHATCAIAEEAGWLA